MLKTGITRVDENDIVVRGYRLSEDLVGKIGFTDFFFLHARGRMPTTEESAVFAALLVNSMDHGINLPVLTARLTYGSAPEAIQGAIAAGILGVGQIADGAIETAASILYDLASQIDGGMEPSKAVQDFVERQIINGYPIAGLGHPLHKTQDPRVERLFAIVKQNRFPGRYVELMRALSSSFSAAKGKDVPVNGAGAVAALYCELGFPATIAKAATIVALSAGIVGHLMEEMRRPMARGLRRVIAEAVEFEEE